MKRSGDRGYRALAGVVAGLAGMAVSHALAMLLTVRVAPLLAVGESVIEITPGPLAESLIQLVGSYDKPLLVIGVSLGLLALAAWAGVITRRSPLLANLVFLVMGAIAAAAVLTRSDASLSDVLAVLAGTLTWIAVLSFLIGQLAAPSRSTASGAAPSGAAPAGPTPSGSTPSGSTPSAADPSRADQGRRGFLIRAGVIVAATAVIGAGGQFLGQARRSVEASRRLLRLPTTAGRVPAGANLGVDGIAAWRSSNRDFYRIDTALVAPAIGVDQWRLRIHGLVDDEIVLTYRDLVEREMTEAWVTLCCVSNEVGGDLVGNAWWSGVRIADILAEAGVDPDANAVLQTSEDGWTCGTPLPALTDDRNAMLAIAMNGEPLPVEHGFPVRMVVPGLYGYVSATKWLVDLEVSRFDDFTAYWTDRGWAAQGPIKTQSRIDVPRDRADVTAGTLMIGGSAFAQYTGIEKVEYLLDGNDWAEATLGRVPGADTWVQWSAEVEVPAGAHTLAVRATDSSGYTQTAVRVDPVPDGATGWHTVDFDAQ
ncbi:MAG TPA: molybdopterin-dependent oxidoreductase [Nocardioidaceae bacterium]|nr:molybdopterin-dependent oxidoreductase [Nocardioidaceae bacterium]